jgi:ATP synthase delta (OSCP) subunit
MRTTRHLRQVRAHNAARIVKLEENRPVRRPKPPLNREHQSASVQSAVALSGNLKARVRADLIRLYGPLRVSFVEIPALTGGMRITVGSDTYYGSVRGTLAALEDQVDH